MDHRQLVGISHQLDQLVDPNNLITAALSDNPADKPREGK